MMFKVKDHYYHKAKKENFAARSVYKLEEIDQRFKILNESDKILDLGYFPGSWVQYASKKVGKSGLVVGVDIQAVTQKIQGPNIKLYQQDVFEIQTFEDVKCQEPFDCVLSDMAPKTTGIKLVDQEKSLQLVVKVFELLPKVLKPHGHFVVKVFESQDAQNFLKNQKKNFKELHYLRPQSTRSVSKEYFVIGKDFRP